MVLRLVKALVCILKAFCTAVVKASLNGNVGKDADCPNKKNAPTVPFFVKGRMGELYHF